MTLTLVQEIQILKYAQPCIPGCDNIDELPNIERISQFLEAGGTTREYFQGPHNQEAYSIGNHRHMAIPYEINKKTARVPQDFLQQFPNLPDSLRQRELGDSEIESSELIKIFYVHVGQIVDSIPK